MRTLIICFSMSGYTRKVAERIRDGIIEATGQCDLKNLSEVDTASLMQYDLIGLGCPVYYYKEPFNISDFIDNLPDLKNRHWFVFCTHGSVMGTTLVSMSERLKRKNALVVGYHHTYAEATAPFFTVLVPTSGHPDKFEYDQAQAFGKEVAKRSRHIAEGEIDLIPTPDPVPEEWRQAAELLTREVVSQAFPPLHIDMEKCSKCHECEEYCPVQGIDVEDDPTRIQNPCIYCFQCAMVCPACAIDGGWDTSDNKEVLAVGRATLDRYIAELKKAETRGEFRWYIDPGNIKVEDNQFKQKKHKLEKSNDL